MCNYTEREFHCGHVRWIVSKWCPLYTRTHRRCPPCVTFFEYAGDQKCGDCKRPTEVVWESMINR
ncbi:hypothetical protein CABS01_16777 [Colletotrichum abscissum]|uniref:Uncharacterized protein n=1 Tax=Colletotrichum abscissum TaxID=1671311 RepID=A0A9P9X1B0_9PEZI|nr:uncharacterized protein CABS01_16777 [Colletotrichum abscissum]KAI3530812.1 hypothetical protein CABS02_14390 [Colletotrichum abscissum]KAK1513937.1 hypothetical protein CABS01_16777 [Colletotrichum abscissum]